MPALSWVLITVCNYILDPDRIEVEHWLLGSMAQESRGVGVPWQKGLGTLREAKQTEEVNVDIGANNGSNSLI